MRDLQILALTLLLLACGRGGDDPSEPRQFGRGEAIEDPVLLEALRTHVHPSVRRATELKLQVDHDIRADLELLASYLRLRPSQPLPELLALADDQLNQERLALADLKAHLDAQVGQARGSPALRTSLGKLLGDQKYSGILDDAASQLAAHGADLVVGQIPQPYPRHNALTITKASQLFLAMAAQNRSLAEMAVLREQLVLLYPAMLPSSVPQELVETLRLAAGRSLWIPNAGYIFGGEAIQGRVRGFDCSAYLSQATDASVRWSTEVMEFVHRELSGDSFDADDPDGSRRTELREHAGFDAVKNEYEAVMGSNGEAATLADLRPGDLVVWRYPKTRPTRSGHVAMHVGREMPRGAAGEFLGLEATRVDDKSREGILLRGFDLDASDAYRFVLRRRAP